MAPTKCGDCSATEPGSSNGAWARGLCSSCYHRHHHLGDLLEFERAYRPRAEVIEDWLFLNGQGYTRPLAAERMGMTRGALDRAIARAKRDGDQSLATEVSHNKTPTPCSVDNCESLATTRGWCAMHYKRWRRHGDPESRLKRGLPIGPIRTYDVAHQRARRAYGRAGEHLCVDCFGPAAAWSYDHQDADEMRDEKGRPFSSRVEHYQPRCHGCHNAFDRRESNRSVA